MLSFEVYCLYELVMNQESTKQIYLNESKVHFNVLDGLRGVAALIIIVFHFMEIIITDFSKNFLAHGFLAVDFFFCLSGFVIAYSYDDRINNIGLKSFFKIRLIRLHPLVILGSVLGLIGFIFDPFSTNADNYAISKITLIFLASSFLIPYPVMPDRYFNLFGLNAPSWSLFWEYVANILYSIFLVKLNKHILLIMSVIAATCIVYIAITSETLIGGWNGSTFWHGGARICFSFLAGMCIFRYQIAFKNKLGFIGLGLLLIAIFLIPYNTKTNWLTEPLIIIVLFPLLIALGVGNSNNNRFSGISTFLGNISYPLYMTHYFIMWTFGSYVANNKPSGFALFFIITSLLIFQIFVAYLALKYFDEPIRKRLKQSLNKKLSLRR